MCNDTISQRARHMHQVHFSQLYGLNNDPFLHIVSNMEAKIDIVGVVPFRDDNAAILCETTRGNAANRELNRVSFSTLTMRQLK